MKKNAILLFTPGNRRDFMEKAAKYNPDAIIIELEDALAINLKPKVRWEVAEIIPKLNIDCLVRVNIEPEHLEEDLNAVISRHIIGILLPKVETIDLIERVDKIITRLERARGIIANSIKLIIGIETALGVLKSFELASSSPRIEGIFCASGEGGDLQANLKCSFSGLSCARSQVVMAGRAAKMKWILDGVFTDLKNDDALRKDCLFSKGLGYDGRALIHPKHIQIAREIYSPDPKEVEYLKRMVKAFKEAEAQGLAAISFEGKLIDYASIRKEDYILSE